MLIFHTADLKQPFSADLPLTYRRPTADLPLTSPPPKGGVPTVHSPRGNMTTATLRTLARERWDKATAFRVGIIAGELNLAIVNPYRGNQASLYRQGLRRGRGPTRNDSAGVGW